MNGGKTSYIIKLDQSCQFKKLGVEWGGEKDFETNWFPKLCFYLDLRSTSKPRDRPMIYWEMCSRGRSERKKRKKKMKLNLENERAIIYSQRTTKDLYGEINI